MTIHRVSTRRARQAGFSMVELLMAAFIMAIGLLGLASLQVMSLRASRGGQSLTVAVQMAERVMDHVEQEGRLSWLNITDSDYANPPALPTLSFIGNAAATYVGFDENGLASAPTGTKPTDARYLATVTSQGTVAASTGRYSDFTVDVEFADEADKHGAKIIRHAIVTRRIIHG